MQLAASIYLALFSGPRANIFSWRLRERALEHASNSAPPFNRDQNTVLVRRLLVNNSMVMGGATTSETKDR